MILIKNGKDVKKIVEFITRLNQHEEHFVGYCGTNIEEVEHTITNDFSDLSLEDSFSVAYLDNQLVGVIGLDVDLESKEAEIWGPFVTHNDWLEVSNLLWQNLLNQISVNLINVYGFYSVRNKNASLFMKHLRASQEGMHTILEIKELNQIGVNQKDVKVVDMTESYFNMFKDLHQQTFKNTYLKAEEIMKKLDKENKLLIAVKNNQLVGYVYCEAEPMFNEASIHYVAVNPSNRKQGVGKLLILNCLGFLFSFNEISEITLCVNNENKGAIQLYKSVGFKVLHELNLYMATKKHLRK